MQVSTDVTDRHSGVHPHSGSLFNLRKEERTPATTGTCPDNVRPSNTSQMQKDTHGDPTHTRFWRHQTHRHRE